MIKISTLFFACLLACTFSANAGTPIIDGIYNPAEGWGTAVGTGDGIAGWAGANAKKFYITSDDNYVYFGAEVKADDWQQFIIAVNSKDGGGTSDPWGRTITYAHANAPDFLFRGDIDKGNYSEYHVWNGTQWTGLGTNINSGGNEVKSTFDGSRNGFLEVRVPKATIGTDIVDAQFIIGGNSSGVVNGHGCFDAIPDDNNCTSWNSPGNASVLTKYVGDVLLPVKLVSLSGSVKGNTASLVWESAEEAGISAYEVQQSADGNSWKTSGKVTAGGVAGKGIYTYQAANMASAVNCYRIKVIDKNGSSYFSKIITFRTNALVALNLVNNPLHNSNLKVSVNIAEPILLQANLTAINGQMIIATQYRHSGGSSMLQLQTTGLQKGMYLLKISSENFIQSFKVLVQ